jgi:hypothetical protein
MSKKPIKNLQANLTGFTDDAIKFMTLQIFVTGLTTLLIEKGIITLEEVEEYVQRASAEEFEKL